MPEVGNMPLPRKILESGVMDMVRISDARMSGTSYGTVVLHVVPLDVPNRSISMDVDDAELDRRRESWIPPIVPGAERGWTRLYVEHVVQADEGCDLDFLQGRSGAAVGPQAF